MPVLILAVIDMPVDKGMCCPSAKIDFCSVFSNAVTREGARLYFYVNSIHKTHYLCIFYNTISGTLFQDRAAIFNVSNFGLRFLQVSACQTKSIDGINMLVVCN